ncbi:MAG: methionine synthase [Candidatus Omnitrophota bacterium]
MNIKFFDSINVSLPKDRVYSRLGYAKGLTKVKPEQKVRIERCIEEALDLIDLKSAAVQIAIEKIDSSRVFLSGGVVFKSNSLGKFLTGCPEALLAAITSGNKITEAIQEKTNSNNTASAVVYDAVASEITDSGLSWIIDYFNNQLRRQNQRLTSARFSAGYGDFSLDNQKIIYEILNLEKIGLSLTESYMLIPEKSVTAVVGIK